MAKLVYSTLNAWPQACSISHLSRDSCPMCCIASWYQMLTALGIAFCFAITSERLQYHCKQCYEKSCWCTGAEQTPLVMLLCELNSRWAVVKCQALHAALELNSLCSVSGFKTLLDHRHAQCHHAHPTANFLLLDTLAGVDMCRTCV